MPYENKHSLEELRQWQQLPLEVKLLMTKERIRQWVNEFGEDSVCVSFSGGKDSTVLLHIVREMYPNVKAVFSNTGLEYPEIQRFVMDHENTEIIRPPIGFKDVIIQFGYPLIGKEVAEAIYYARKLRGGQTADKHKAELNGNRIKPSGQNLRGGRRVNLSRQAQREIAELSSQGKCQEKSRTYRGAEGSQCEITWWGGGNKTKSEIGASSWGAVCKDGTIRRAGVAKNSNEAIFSEGEKSQFNKEKWLPIARDLPVLISHKCCGQLKKYPMQRYQRKNKLKPFLATMAEESRVRAQAWVRQGCNAYDGKEVKSTPIAFWTEQDVLQYIVQNGIQIASVYGDIVSEDEDGFQYPATPMTCEGCKLKCTGAQRTGCIFCGFGFHMEKGETRFQRLAKTHPKQYEYALGGGEWSDNPFYDPAAPKMDGEWQNWNPKKIWTPNAKGLGMRKVFEMCNEIYGKDFYRYE